MAVDSRDKRMSMISFGQPVPFVMPNPDGAIGISDRRMLLSLYFGITLGPFVDAVWDFFTWA